MIHQPNKDRTTTPPKGNDFYACCAKLSMASSNIEMNINVSSEVATRKIEKVTREVEKLKKALDELKQIEIGVEVVNIKKKWWQFWR